MANTLLSISEVTSNPPLPGTFRVVEEYGGKVNRVVWACPRCKGLYWEFFGLNGKKLNPANRLRRDCEDCLQIWRKKREDRYTNYGSYYGKGVFTIPYPASIFLEMEGHTYTPKRRCNSYELSLSPEEAVSLLCSASEISKINNPTDLTELHTEDTLPT